MATHWKVRLSLGAAIAATLVAAHVARADDTPAWAKAPATARGWANPYAARTDAVRAGHKLFARHCAECHGENGRGGRNAPPLEPATIGRATEGDLFWLLTNGDLRTGMPSWSHLPDARRWQIVSFLKTLDAGGGASR